VGVFLQSSCQSHDPIRIKSHVIQGKMLQSTIAGQFVKNFFNIAGIKFP
jgi:hypothetical protein